jgi:membrane associated rhomboid family serine protease
LSAVNRRLGDGRGPLVVLISGALGNWMNAMWHRTAHLSIGASTAVFGAVGVLAATQLALDQRDGDRPWLQRVAPVVGGLALLGMLGASPHSDLLAHLFGLGAGLAVGVATSILMALTGRKASKTPLPDGVAATPNAGSRITQVLSALAAIAIVTGSWVLAFRAM